MGLFAIPPANLPCYHYFMPQLPNPKHEIFAQMLARGLPQYEAYINAGYSEIGARANSTRLIANDNIKNRLSELQAHAAAASQITMESLLAEMEKISTSAYRCGHYHAAIRSVEAKAKLLGFVK